MVVFCYIAASILLMCSIVGLHMFFGMLGDKWDKEQTVKECVPGSVWRYKYYGMKRDCVVTRCDGDIVWYKEISTGDTIERSALIDGFIENRIRVVK